MLIVLLCLIAIILLLYYQRWLKRDIHELSKQLHSGIWSLPFIGHGYLLIGGGQTRMKGLQILGRDAIRNVHGLTSTWLGNNLYTMIADPKAAEIVLKRCLEKDDIMQLMRFYIGDASFIAPVSMWRHRRKLLVQCFSTKNLKYYMSVFENQSDILVQEMGKMAGAGPLASWKYYTAYTMDAITEATFGYKMGAQKCTDNFYLKAFDFGFTKVTERLCRPWLHSDLVYTNLPVYRKQMEKKKIAWYLFTELVNNKRKEIKEKDDNHINESEGSSMTFMESLIRVSGVEKGYTNDELIEELLVIMLAGNDTSAVASSFISVMLSRHPEVQDKVYKELREVFGDSDRKPTLEDLPRLKYLDAVIKETLRLYPPVPVILRKIDKCVDLPTGIRLVPGTGVFVNIWAIHRNPRYWGDDAEVFRPERFIDTPLKHPTAFMPFSYGPRNCVGYHLAMMSLKTLFSSLLRRYKILPATAPTNHSEFPPLRLKFDLMMKDEDDCQIRIESRF